MTEQEWIEYLKTILPKNRKILASYDEDCGVIKIAPNRYLLLTTDALVEGVHFKPDYFSFYDLGYKLSVANLSDIAAMGGTPHYALLTLGSNRPLHLDWLKPLLEGLKAALQKYSARLVGGDTVKSPVFFLNLTLVGEAESPVLRSRAKPGDRIFVSKSLGASSAFLRLIKESPLREIPEEVRLAHLRPEAEVKLGKHLSSVAKAMIDISDGLLLDLHRLCSAAKVGALLMVERIPVANGATLDEALSGGEDYALLFTVTEKDLPKIQKIEKTLRRKMYEIGYVIKDRKILLKDKQGVTPVTPRGYDHFTSQSQS